MKHLERNGRGRFCLQNSANCQYTVGSGTRFLAIHQMDEWWYIWKLYRARKGRTYKPEENPLQQRGLLVSPATPRRWNEHSRTAPIKRETEQSRTSTRETEQSRTSTRVANQVEFDAPQNPKSKTLVVLMPHSCEQLQLAALHRPDSTSASTWLCFRPPPLFFKPQFPCKSYVNKGPDSQIYNAHQILQPKGARV